MKIRETSLPGVLLLEPTVHRDGRGYLFESFRADVLEKAGLPRFVATLVLAVPATIVAARLFATVFELPFQRHRSWSALRAALRGRPSRGRL